MAQQETIPQIRNEIERSKEDMARTAHEIEYRVGELKNWRTAVSRYPLASLGVSVGLGLLASGILPDVLRSAMNSVGHSAGPMVRSSLIAYVAGALKN